MTGIFKAYDIRGSYPDELDETSAEKIGFAFARVMKSGMIAVGRDSRLSSPALASSFIRGFVGAGGHVTDFGKTSSPLLYYAIIKGKFDGGAMVTASHLTPEMNGIKLCRENAIPLSGDEGLPALQRMVEERAEGTGRLPGAADSRVLQNRGFDRFLYRGGGQLYPYPKTPYHCDRCRGRNGRTGGKTALF